MCSQDGWILAKFFLSRSIKTHKKLGQYSAILTEQVWSVKDLLHGEKRELLLAGAAREIRSGRVG